MSKLLTFKTMLDLGDVFVHLASRFPGVVAPHGLMAKDHIVLQYGPDMPIPIPDLRVDHYGIFGTLSFSRTPFACIVPWGAVFALFDERRNLELWPESRPKARKPLPPYLRLVK